MSKKNGVRMTVFAALIISIMMLCACGSEVPVSIKDQKITSEITISTGKTVADALKEAGIVLGDKDTVEPAADTKITEDLKEITVNRYALVTIIDGNEKKEAEVIGGTVGDALKAAGITLGKNDTLLEIKENDPAEDGMTITVVHSKVIDLQADGEKKEVSTEAATVKELLDEQNITVGKDDIVEPAMNQKIENGDTVTVKRVTFKEEEVKEEIPYETKTEKSDTLEAGTSEVTQKGKAGERTAVVRIRYIDGEEADRETVSENVTKKPVDEIITKGTKKKEKAAEEKAEQEAEQSAEQTSEPAPGENYPEEYYEEEYYEPEENYEPEPERYVVSQVAYPNCDDGSHGYYEITYSDGTVEYVEY